MPEPPFGGPHGPMGPGPNHMGHLYEHGHYGMFARPGQIQGSAGYANGTPGSGVENFTAFETLKSNLKYSIQKKGILKGICIGFVNFISEPATDFRYTMVRNMTMRKFQEKRLTKEQYDYRMIQNEERLLYRNLRRGYIDEETYNKSMDKLENQYSSVRL